MIETKQKFNFFISHSKETKATMAIPIAQALSNIGFCVWLDRKELSVGEQIYVNIQTAIEDTQYCVAIIDNAFLERAWTLEEIRSFYDKGDYNIIPIYVNLEKELVYEKIPWMEGLAFEKINSNIFNIDEHIDIICRILSRFYSDNSTYDFRDIFSDISQYNFSCKDTLMTLIQNGEYYSTDYRIAIIELCNIGGIIYAIYNSLCNSRNLIIETMFQFNSILRAACFNLECSPTYNMYISIYKAIISSAEQLKVFLNPI